MRHVRWLFALALLLAVSLGTASCRTTPLDNIWPGCCAPNPCPPVQVATPAPCAPCGTAEALPWSVEIDEHVSPAVDCNPVRTQHTLVVTVKDQCGNPLPGQRVEWILARYPEAVGDIVAVDDQYGSGVIAPLRSAMPSNGGNKIDNHYAVSVTNYGAEMIDAGNNHPYLGSNGQRLPDITVGRGQSWLTITSTREGVTDIIVYVPAIRDGTKHKVWAKKIWADFDVEFPENSVNVLPDSQHHFPVRLFRSDGSGIPGQSVDAEILDGPSAVFQSTGGPTATVVSNANGIAEFVLQNTSGDVGTNRIRFTANGNFYGETCPRSAIVTKRWQKVALDVSCSFPGGPTAVVGKPFEKLISVTNTGDTAAKSVMLDDHPAGGLRLADGVTFPMEVGPIAPGQTVTKTVRLMADAGGTYTNTVSATSPTSKAKAESTCPIEIVQGNLEITKVCEPGRVNAGGEVTFVVTVSNTGRGPLDNVMVKDDYPKGIEPTSQDTAQIGTLRPNESQQVLFTGVADAPGTYTNTARATADGVKEKSATCSLEVVTCNLKMDLKGPDSIYYNEKADFTINIHNVGNGDAEACVVRVQTGDCLGNVVKDFNVGPLAPGATFTQVFPVTATKVGPCTVTADSNCGARCQTEALVKLKVTGLPAIQTEMTDKALDGTEQGIFRVGETFIYRLTVENDVGTEDTPPMVVHWTLPPQLEFVSGRSDQASVTVTGSGQTAQSSSFTLPLNGMVNFEIQVRVLQAPPSNFVTTLATINRQSDNQELAREVESTTLKD